MLYDLYENKRRKMYYNNIKMILKLLRATLGGTLWAPQRKKLVRLCGPQLYEKSKLYKIYKNEIHIYIQKLYICFWTFSFSFLDFQAFDFPKICFLLFFLVQVRGWDGLYRIDETKLACAISRKLTFGWFWGWG